MAHPRFYLQLRPGDRLRSFQFVRLLGRGGIGEVWEIAYQGKRYALKIIQTQWLDNPGQIRRMKLEGALLVTIKHPFVVDVLETGVSALEDEPGVAKTGVVWIRMELLVGGTLRDTLRRRGLLSITLICAYLRQMAIAAHQCHIIGVIHRDIKPENIWITEGDEIAKLLDFGLAKVPGTPDTTEGQRHGTPLYMAPEHIRGRATFASDVYSLGMVGYEAFWGVHPFLDDDGEPDIHTLYYRHFSVVPAPLTDIGIPREIAAVIQKAVEKDPKRRYPNGLAFAEALSDAWQAVEEQDPVSSETNPGEPSRDELREHAEEGLRFGTGPTKADERRSGPVVRARTEPLPPELRDPEAVRVHREQRRSGPRLLPRALTERLPDALRDPSSVRALAEKEAVPWSSRETRGGAPLPEGWAPVRITEPLAIASAAKVHAPEPPPMSASRSRCWMEVPDPEAAGVRVVPDMEPLLDDEEEQQEEPPPSSAAAPYPMAPPYFPPARPDLDSSQSLGTIARSTGRLPALLRERSRIGQAARTWAMGGALLTIFGASLWLLLAPAPIRTPVPVAAPTALASPMPPPSAAPVGASAVSAPVPQGAPAASASAPPIASVRAKPKAAPAARPVPPKARTSEIIDPWLR